MWQFVFKVSNAAITAFLYISKQLLLCFGQIFNCIIPKKGSDVLPLTIKSVRRLISLQQNDLENFAVCPSCNSVYEFNECVQRSLMGSQRESKACRHVYYPNHSHVSQRTPCGTLLLKPRQILGCYQSKFIHTKV